MLSVGLTVNGNSVTLPSGSDSYGAIDTGTTLISGPEDVVAALYAQIPNSEALTGQNEGFYQYRESSRQLAFAARLTATQRATRR